MKSNKLTNLVLVIVLLAALGMGCQKVPDQQAEGVFMPSAYIKDTLTMPYNLTVEQDLSVEGDAAVTGTLAVTGAATLGSVAMGDLDIEDLTLSGVVVNDGGAFRVNDTATITGATTIIGNLDLQGNLADSGNDNLRIADNVLISGTLGAVGNLSTGGSLAVLGNVSDTGATLRLNDNTLITGTLNVSGVATFNSGARSDSLFTASNGIDATGGITQGVGDDFVMAGGQIWDDSGSLILMDTVNLQGDLEVLGDITMNAGGRLIQNNGPITVSGELYVTNDADFGADINVLNDVRISDFLIMEDVELSGIITVTEWITPTRSNQRITAEAWVTPTVNGGCVPGMFWILYNWGSENIFLVDGGSLLLTEDFLMAQHDTLMLMCNAGGSWAELSRANN